MSLNTSSLYSVELVHSTVTLSYLHYYRIPTSFKACAIAKQLGITQVLVNRFGSILSAYGLGLADEKEENTVPFPLHFSLLPSPSFSFPPACISMSPTSLTCQEMCKVDYLLSEESFSEISGRLYSLSKECGQRLLDRGFTDDRIQVQPLLNLFLQLTCRLKNSPTCATKELTRF